MVRPGDEVVALPSGARSRVRTVVTWEGERTEAFAPMAVTLTLADEIDVSRGDMLVRPENLPRVDRNLDAMVVWMADEPLRPGRQYWIKHTGSLVTGTVSSLRYRIDVNSLQRQEAAGAADERGGTLPPHAQPAGGVRRLPSEPGDGRVHPDRPHAQRHRGRRDDRGPLERPGVPAGPLGGRHVCRDAGPALVAGHVRGARGADSGTRR